MIGALTFATFAITLDGKPALPRVRAAVADGRVLLPVRALGEALGADVSYDGAAHRIVVQRGARVASLSSRGAVRVVHGRAYAPLRATAAAFGLGVSYEGAARTVALQSPRTRGGAMGPPISSQASFPPGLRVASTPVTPILTPGAGAAIHSVYPSISARFPGMTAIDPGSLRLLLDGRDVSRDAAVIGDEVLYTPRSALPPGAHAVALDARAINGTPLHVAWDFQDSFAFAPAVAPTPFPITAIYLDRWVTPGTNAFDVIVRGAPGLTGYVGVDGVGGYFPLSVLTANAYVAHVFVPPGVYQPFARVAARITMPNGVPQTIVLPQTVSLYTPVRTAPPPAAPAIAATPTPMPHVRVVPTMPRSVHVPTPYPSGSPSPSRDAPAALRNGTAHTMAPRPAATTPAPTLSPTPSPTPRRPARHYPRSRATAEPSATVPS